MKFQIPSMHHSEVLKKVTNRRTHSRTDRQTSRKQYALPTFSKLGAEKVGGINNTGMFSLEV